MTPAQVDLATGIWVRWVVGIGARSGIDVQRVRDALDELWRRLAELGSEPAGAFPAHSAIAGSAGTPAAQVAGSAVVDPARSVVVGPARRAVLSAAESPVAGPAAWAPDVAAPVVYASVPAKAREPGILAAIAPARLVVLDAAELAAVEVPHPSERVGRAVGTPSVAEAAALAVAGRLGSGARLAVPKIVRDGVTVAAACSRQHRADLR